MQKHLLITVSGEKSAMDGARFVAGFIHRKDKMHLTLYYTAARPLPPASGQSMGTVRAVADERERRGRKALAQAREFLVAKGFDSEQIHDKFAFRKRSAAVDIFKEGEDGLYDAVVLGRRGLSRLEELMVDSVSRELLSLGCTFPIWVCRRPEIGRRDVLLCVDDSPQSYRMVDHASFMLSSEPDHHMTLLHVCDPGAEDRAFAQSVFERCEELVTANDMDLGRVRTRIVEDFSPIKAIKRFALRGQFAVVGVGRTGVDQGFLRRMFLGSVSSALYRDLHGAALWLSR